MTRADKSLLVRLACARLLRCDEPRADPDGLRTVDQIRGEPTPVVHCAGADDPNRLAGQRRGTALDGVDHRRDQDGCGYVPGVSAALACLGTDDIDTGVECLADVLGVANHLPIRQLAFETKGREREIETDIHDEDAGFVESVDDFPWWYTNGGYE